MDGHYEFKQASCWEITQMVLFCLREFRSHFSIRIYSFWTGSMYINKTPNLISQDQQLKNNTLFISSYGREVDRVNNLVLLKSTKATLVNSRLDSLSNLYYIHLTD